MFYTTKNTELLMCVADAERVVVYPRRPARECTGVQ